MHYRTERSEMGISSSEAPGLWGLQPIPGFPGQSFVAEVNRGKCMLFAYGEYIEPWNNCCVVFRMKCLSKFDWIQSIMRCNLPCPHNASGRSVRNCQGDLFLCTDCENFRFPSVGAAAAHLSTEANLLRNWRHKNDR